MPKASRGSKRGEDSRHILYFVDDGMRLFGKIDNIAILFLFKRGNRLGNAEKPFLEIALPAPIQQSGRSDPAKRVSSYECVSKKY